MQRNLIKVNHIHRLFDFWTKFWGRGLPSLPEINDYQTSTDRHGHPNSDQTGSVAISETMLSSDITKTILLPSSHHQNPNFRPFCKSVARDRKRTNIAQLTPFHLLHHSTFISYMFSRILNVKTKLSLTLSSK